MLLMIKLLINQTFSSQFTEPFRWNQRIFTVLFDESNSEVVEQMKSINIITNGLLKKILISKRRFMDTKNNTINLQMHVELHGRETNIRKYRTSNCCLLS